MKLKVINGAYNLKNKKKTKYFGAKEIFHQLNRAINIEMKLMKQKRGSDLKKKKTGGQNGQKNYGLNSARYFFYCQPHSSREFRIFLRASSECGGRDILVTCHQHVQALNSMCNIIF